MTSSIPIKLGFFLVSAMADLVNLLWLIVVKFNY